MKNYRKIILILVPVVVLMVFFSQVFILNDDIKVNKETKSIVSLSTYALYDIAQHISQNTFELVMILPIGVDVHSYELTPKIMKKIDKSELVIYSGAGLEPWTEGFEFKTRVVNMSQFVRLREIETDEHHMHTYHDQQCAHDKIDPHYWLDIQNMAKATNLIASEFVRLQPNNKELYLKNRDKYLAMLKNLDTLYKDKLSSCYLDTIIVNHNAYSYLSKRYGFNVESLVGFSSDAEATPKDMIRVINEIKKHNVETIFFESFANNKVMKSLAQEVKVDVQTLQPLGNITKDEHTNGFTYEKIMKTNLAKISKALICK